MSETESLGIWWRDARGGQEQAHGSARLAAVRQQVLPALERWLRRGLASGLFAVEAEPTPLVVMAWTVGPAQLMLIRPVGEDDDALTRFLATVPFATAVLGHFLASPHDAISVVDRAGRLCYISPTHERWLGLRPGEALGRPANEVIPNSRMAEVVSSGIAEIGHPYSADGVATRIVSRIPIHADGAVVGVVGRTLFKGPEVVQRMYREVSRLQSEVARYQRTLGVIAPEPESLARLVGHSAPMQALKKEIRLVAELDVPVLILGESGVGKELVAQALHDLSPRREQQLVSLNLAALPASLLESELFGYAPGSFTGGHKQGRIGKFELADRSTVFLDEVGDIPADIQVKLLRVLEDHQVERLGAHRSRKVDFRLVAATHHKMDELVAAGRFRLDLFYRLAGVTLHVPSLSERLEDIPELLTRFVQQFCARNRWEVPELHAELAPFLAQQAWPGNVRQLRQRIEEALVFSAGQALERRHFERHGAGRPARAQAPALARAVLADSQPTMAQVMQRAARQAVEDLGGNKQKAARALGISRSHLYRLLG
ncbi:sigma-54 interaction domain-containing protein [Hydrogenophaga borbori]|uniref:sigma-54 interaction domain-containing protein n=1 Tax=Hydrogenophaga borbori TaxID=2294117 RepID=UPI001FE39E93|nr:sigma 54-interacting transcriptional regulator [Hydrogenophaga borbori]